MENQYRDMSKSFEIVNNKLYLVFDQLELDDEYIQKKLKQGGNFYNTFYFKPEDMVCSFENDVEIIIEHPTFEIGVIENNYVKLKKDVFKINYYFYFDKEINFNVQKFSKYFYKYPNTSIIKTMINYVDDSVLIDLEKNFKVQKNHVPFSVFKKLIKEYPSASELNCYKSKQICSILSDYFDTKDYGAVLQQIKDKQIKMNRERFDQLSAEFHLASSIDLNKNKLILSKLKEMLALKIDEKEWQRMLLPFIKLLYPKFIFAIDEIEIIDNNCHERRIDYILIDYDDNIDIIELKTPETQLLRKYPYRNNYIESKDLSGAIMQCEKYIYYLSSNKSKLEGQIKDNIFKKTGKTHNVKINHPKAIVFAGRSSEFSTEQHSEDFQIIKRKYSNLVDILTYDDLIFRLENLIRSAENNEITENVFDMGKES